MLSQSVQSMTKTKSPIATPVPPPLPPTMENVNNVSSSGSSTTSIPPSSNNATSGTPATAPIDVKMGAGVSKEGSNAAVVVTSSSLPAGGGRNETGNVEHLPKVLVNVLPVVTQCIYTPCYCEENVWKMCDKVRCEFPSELDYCHVAFISNKKRMVPMWRQKSGKNDEKLALWDYHVILFYNPDERCLVYDMDSELPFPTHFHRYISETFRTENILQPEYHRFFRIIPASRFLLLFSSDRSHMLRPEDKSWIKPPPNYPPICSNGVNNLEQFIDMTDLKNEFGEVFTLMDLVRKFYKPRQLS